MFARIVTFQGKPNQVDAGIRNQREQVLPTVKKMSGFKGGYLLIDRKTGKQMVISLWDTEKDMQASSSAMGSLRTQFAKQPVMPIHPLLRFSRLHYSHNLR